MLAITLVAAYFFLLLLAATASASPPFGLQLKPNTYRGHTAGEWAAKFRHRTRQLQLTRQRLKIRWQPTVNYALQLASAVSGVSYWQLRSVSYCESTHNPFAINGRYKGLFQLSWSPFGFDPYDPVANALSAALTVRSDGSWRQWECKP